MKVRAKHHSNDAGVIMLSFVMIVASITQTIRLTNAASEGENGDNDKTSAGDNSNVTVKTNANERGDGMVAETGKDSNGTTVIVPILVIFGVVIALFGVKYCWQRMKYEEEHAEVRSSIPSPKQRQRQRRTNAPNTLRPPSYISASVPPSNRNSLRNSFLDNSAITSELAMDPYPTNAYSNASPVTPARIATPTPPPKGVLGYTPTSLNAPSAPTDAYDSSHTPSTTGPTILTNPTTLVSEDVSRSRSIGAEALPPSYDDAVTFRQT